MCKILKVSQELCKLLITKMTMKLSRYFCAQSRTHTIVVGPILWLNVYAVILVLINSKPKIYFGSCGRRTVKRRVRGSFPFQRLRIIPRCMCLVANPNKECKMFVNCLQSIGVKELPRLEFCAADAFYMNNVWLN